MYARTSDAANVVPTLKAYHRSVDLRVDAFVCQYTYFISKIVVVSVLIGPVYSLGPRFRDVRAGHSLSVLGVAYT